MREFAGYTQLILLTLLLCLGFTWPVCAQETPMPALSITITAPKTSVPVGYRMKLVIRVTNTSDQDAPFDSDGTYKKEPIRSVGIMVRDHKGTLVAETEYGRGIHGHLGGMRTNAVARYLKPGEVFKEESDLSDEFDLTKPGIYTVEVGYWDFKSHQTIMSNKITFTITPAPQND